MSPVNACSSLFARTEPLTPVRVIHVDLKGCPPTARRFREWLSLFASARYNAVLVEWEDAFPWRFAPELCSPTAYSDNDLSDIIACAADLGLELIPLVQTLGHMETPLRQPRFAPLRELPHDPYTINPLAIGSLELIRTMVSEVLDRMPAIRRFHLGADEAWSLGYHPDTRAFIAQYGKSALMRAHLEPVMDMLLDRGIRPLLWHDMFIDFPDADLDAIVRRADFVVWGYGEHPDVTPLHYNTRHIHRLHERGATLWGATACKGASGYDSDLPDVPARLDNASHWIDIHRRYGLAGIVATAWSRYSTDNMACEPFDAAMDAMMAVGVVLHDGCAPEDIGDTCRSALCNLPEGCICETCRTAMQRLSLLRCAGWDAIRMLRQHLAQAEGSSCRRGTLPCSSLRALRQIAHDARAVETTVRNAFRELIPACWLDEYLTSRLEPLREELRHLEPRIRAVTPANVWEFEEVHHHRPMETVS